MKINLTTKKGDSGYTSLMFGDRVRKTDVRIEALGKLDTFHASLGLVHELLDAKEESDRLNSSRLVTVQKALILLSGELAVVDDKKERYFRQYPTIEERDLNDLESFAAEIVSRMQRNDDSLAGWALYGLKNSIAARLDFSAKLCREAEIAVLRVIEEKFTARSLVPKYLNRLSDVLYLMARDREYRGQSEKIT